MIRFTARPRGKVHVDVAIRSGVGPHNLGLCGNVCMGADDWRQLRAALERGRHDDEPVEILEPKEEA